MAALGVLAGAARPAAADSANGTLVADTFVNSGGSDSTANNNMGGSHGITVGLSGHGGSLRGLVLFNVPAGLTGRVIVSGTTVTLTVAGIGTGLTGGSAAIYSLFKITQNWSEGTGANDTVMGFNHGQSCVGMNGASWNQAVCSTGTNWATPGGSAAASASAMASSVALVNSTLSFSSGACAGANLSCDVQSWIDNGSAFGWLISSSSTATGQAQKFYSRESGTSPPTLAFTFGCKAGYFDTGSTCTTCTTAAKSACVVTCPSTGGSCTNGQPSGNTCNDSGPPSTTYTCTCNNPAYTGTGTTSCTDKDECAGNPCATGGDTSATCTDAVAPSTGYSCGCNTGFTFNGTTCVSQCRPGMNPCNVNGDSGSTCTVVGTGGWTCSCTTGYTSSGGTTPACVNYDACTMGGGNTACVTTCPSTGGTCTSGQPSGNGCTDLLPPSMSYTCTCSNTAYTGTGTTSCTDKNECTGNPCAANGDATATCTDAVAPNTSHTCTCSAGFIASNQGTSSASCVDACSPSTSGTPSDPCGHGTCTVAGSGWTCACNAGYVSTGGTDPICVDYNACTAGGGNTACVTTCPSTGGTCTAGQPSGNVCNDLPPPSLSYTCTCSNGAYAGTGTAMCSDKNGCVPNQCTANGDASATCTDAVAPNIGYSCACDTGFTNNGTSCVSKCPGPPDPCGNGGMCTSTGAGTWTCNCPGGFASSGGNQPACLAVVCGDGVVQGSEQCDNGAANGTVGSCCSATCSFVAVNTVCRAANGACDVSEACDGISPACPADVPKSAGTVCAPATECMQASTCTGASDSCPAQAPVSDGTQCSVGTCVGGTCAPVDMTSSGPVDMTSPSNADMAGSPSAGGDMLGPGNGASGCGCRVGGATGNADGGWIVCVLLAGFALMRRRLRISGEGVLKSPKSQECPNRVQNTGE